MVASKQELTMSAYAGYLIVQQKQQSARDLLASLQRELASHGHLTKAAACLLDSASGELEAACSTTSDLLPHIPPHARVSPAAEIVSAKVFSIPELIERILLELDVYELLTAQRVSRVFFDAIQGSR